MIITWVKGCRANAEVCNLCMLASPNRMAKITCFQKHSSVLYGEDGNPLLNKISRELWDNTNKSIPDRACKQQIKYVNSDHLEIIVTTTVVGLASARIQNGLHGDYRPIYQRWLWSVSQCRVQNDAGVWQIALNYPWITGAEIARECLSE